MADLGHPLSFAWPLDSVSAVYEKGLNRLPLVPCFTGSAKNKIQIDPCPIKAAKSSKLQELRLIPFAPFIS